MYFQKGNLQDFDDLIGEPTKTISLFQIFEGLVLIVEKVLMNGETLSEKLPTINKFLLIKSIVYNSNYKNSSFWENFKWENLGKTGFYIEKENWEIESFKWEKNSKKEKNLLSSFVNRKKLIFVFDNNQEEICSVKLKEKNIDFIGKIEKSKGEIWFIEFEREIEKIQLIDEVGKIVGCNLIANFVTKANSQINIISLDIKNKIDILRRKFDQKALNSNFERIPQFDFYLIFISFFPFDGFIF